MIIINKTLKDFSQVFEKAGFEAYLVGGAVRDIFLKKTASDWDVATNATPNQVMSLFKFVVPTGIDHGTVTVHFRNAQIEVTTFRVEGKYSDGRHPDSIAYAGTIQEDLSRRDFTMNAIAIEIKSGKIIDPFNGRKDIKKKIIRTVGSSYERFMEDGLRPIRGIRFCSQLGFRIEQETYNQMFKNEILQKISSISVERFRDEFVKLLKTDKPSIGLKKLEETGILKIFIPELLECRGCVQSDKRGFHKFDVLDHLFYSCDGAPSNKLNVRLAALFHDIAKPKCKKIKIENGVEKITFYNHDIESSKITKQIMINLKFSNAEIDNVCHLISQHMFHYETDWSDSAVRRFLVRVKFENVEDLFDLRLADIYGMNNRTPRIHDSITGEKLSEFKDRITQEISKQNALSLKDLKVNGKILMENGIPSGKILGEILNNLFETVLEDPKINEKEILIKIAKNLYKDIVKE